MVLQLIIITALTILDYDCDRLVTCCPYSSEHLLNNKFSDLIYDLNQIFIWSSNINIGRIILLLYCVASLSLSFILPSDITCHSYLYNCF